MDFSDSSGDDNLEEQEIEEIEKRDFEAEKKQIINNLLPNKSRSQYELAYANLLKWTHENKAKINEDTLIVYFKELSSRWKASTLWSHWSKLRATLSLRHNININDFILLKAFLKKEA